MAFGFGFGFGLQALAVGSRPTLALNFTGPTLDPQITFTRSTTATYTNSSGVLTTAAINGARFDYNPVTLAPKGLLIEEQRTNLLLQSQFASSWVNFATSTITANSATAPDGTTTAALISSPATGDYVYQTPTTSIGATYAFSFFVKNSTATISQYHVRTSGTAAIGTLTWSGATLSSITPTVGTASFVAIANNWYIVSVIYTATETAARHRIGGGNGVSTTGNILVYGAQLEAGAFATSYIPTVASQVTRAADVAVMTGTNFSSWYNQSEGTFVASYILGADSLSIGVIGVDDNTSSNVIQMRYTSGSAAQFTISVGGVTQVSLAPSGYSTAGTYKRAIAYKVNSFNQAINGALPNAEDTSGTLPVVTQARIGNEASSNFINGHIQSITYYPSRLSNAELLALSA